MCIEIIWNNSFLVGGHARAEARIDPRPLRTSCSTAHGAQVVWPLDYMGRASGRSNLTKGRIAAAHGWLNHIRQSPTPLTADECTCPVGDNATIMPAVDEHICHHEGWQIGRHVFFPKIARCTRRSGPKPIHVSLGPHENTTKLASRSVQPFLQGSQLTDRQCYLVCNKLQQAASMCIVLQCSLKSRAAKRLIL